jgi:hypothetical protein
MLARIASAEAETGVAVEVEVVMRNLFGLVSYTRTRSNTSKLFGCGSYYDPVMAAKVEPLINDVRWFDVSCHSVS